MRLKVDMRLATEAFNAATVYASKLTGLDRRKIILAEAGSVLKACAEETKVAPVSKVTAGAILRALRGAGLTRGGQFTVNAGVKDSSTRGRVFMMKKGGAGAGYRRTYDAGFKVLNQHYRGADWIAMKQVVELAEAKMARVLDRAPESVALARNSWVLLADSLGIRLEEVPGGRLSAGAIDKARRARARNDAQVNNAASIIDNAPDHFFITLINRYPAGMHLGFDRMLAVKIAGRSQFLMRACQKGFDGSFQQTARLFPGWVVNKGPMS